MSPRHLLVPAALLAALSYIPPAAARAYYAPLSEVIEQVEAVAILEVARIDAVEIAGAYWNYHELVHANVVDVVAGALPGEVEIVGGRDFVCAPVNWEAGPRYLALLVRDGDHWTATNNTWGRIEIHDGMIAWPYDRTQDVVPVADVVAMLEARLAKRLGPGRIVDTGRVEPDPPPAAPERVDAVEVEVEVQAEVVPEVVPEPEVAAADPRSAESDAPLAHAPAPWIVVGAAAVAFGFVVGTRGRR